jgi:intracellular septation protein A
MDRKLRIKSVDLKKLALFRTVFLVFFGEERLFSGQKPFLDIKDT